jgi:hypothetical protein
VPGCGPSSMGATAFGGEVGSRWFILVSKTVQADVVAPERDAVPQTSTSPGTLSSFRTLPELTTVSAMLAGRSSSTNR